MMPFLLAEFANKENVLPLYVVCVGSHDQKPMDRPSGYPEHQLFLCRNGSGIFRLAGRQDTVMAPGTALVLPAGAPHSYFPADGDDTWELGFVSFNGKAAASLLGLLGDNVSSVFAVPRFDLLWEKLVSLWHLISLNGENAYWETSKRVYDMLLFLLEEAAPSAAIDRVNAKVGQPNAGLHAAVKLIHEHYGERLLLSNVARAAGYSVQHFHRLFAVSYGVTPQQYILRLRMRRAVELFGDVPGIAVEKVAQHLGMETSYFIRMFKKTYGMTPLVWRKTAIYR